MVHTKRSPVDVVMPPPRYTGFTMNAGSSACRFDMALPIRIRTVFSGGWTEKGEDEQKRSKCEEGGIATSWEWKAALGLLNNRNINEIY